MKYLAVLGRQPEISLAELEALFDDVSKQSKEIAFFSSKEEPNIDRLGGSLKLAKSLENISPEEYLLSQKKRKITSIKEKRPLCPATSKLYTSHFYRCRSS